MDFLSAIVDALSIKDEIISVFSNISFRSNQKKLRELGADLDYGSIADDLLKYAEEADKYIAERHLNRIGDKVITDDDRSQFCDKFYSVFRDSRMYRESVDVYLNAYLDKLDKLLSGMMSAGEKFINKRVSDILAIVEDIPTLKKDIKEIKKDVGDLRENLIDTGRISDTLPVLIDKKYIEEHRADASQLERCRFEYYNVSTSTDSIFKAVINGLSVAGEEYDEIIQSIYKTTRESRILFLMGDSGMGKSTLMCEVAVRAAQDGYRIYFADSRVDVNDDYCEKIREDTFFFLDNVSTNLKLIDRLYIFSEKNHYIHVILSDRIHRINALIDELDIPGWIIDGKAIILKNDGDFIYHIALPKRNITQIVLSKKLRKEMSDEVIASTIAYEELDEETAKMAQREIIYTRRSVMDIFLDFCIKYNATAGTNVKPVKSHSWDWDIWDEIPELKGHFGYLAALTCYGVSISVYQMVGIVGSPLDIGRWVDEGKLPIIHVDGQGIIKLRHDTVADNYFKIKKIQAVDVIKNLFENRKIDEKMVVEFEREVFSLSNIFNAGGEVKRLHIPELVGEFNKINEYREILIKHQRIHSLELAVIGVKAKGAREKEKYYRIQIGRSYEKVNGFYKNELFLWIKYFFFAANHADTIPDELLSPLQTIPGLYKKVTKVIDTYIKRAYRSFTDDERKKWFSYIEELFNWIIKNIDKDDMPSRMLLLWIYRRSDQIEQVQKMVSEISGLDASKIPEVSVTYIQTYQGEVRKLVKRNRDDPKIRKMNRFIWKYYQNLLEHTDKTTEEYVMIVRSYVRFQKDTGHFNDAYQTALATVEYMTLDYPGISVMRLYVELGMICQYRNRRNKYFNLNEAINWFGKAIEKMEPSSRELLYALKPLCKSYLVIGQFEECIKICNRIKKFDSRDREAVNMRCEAMRLQRIRRMQLPVETYRWEKKPKSEELEYEFNKLIHAMTEEQLVFAKLFGLEEAFQKGKCKDKIYRVAFSIKNNTYIPLGMLLKLEIADRSMLKRLM